MRLVFCAGGNARFAELAREAGFDYGARLPGTTYGQVSFADQDWRKPNRSTYMAALALHRPATATVLDWTGGTSLDEVLSWAAEAASYVQQVVIIPKVPEVERIPQIVGTASVVLGYSVPTSYGGTEIPLWCFAGRPTHLLGGSPQRQLLLARYLNVVSVDVNMHQRMATSRCCYWQAKKTVYGHWQPLQRAVETDAPYEAFRRSCANIMAAWNG